MLFSQFNQTWLTYNLLHCLTTVLNLKILWDRHFIIHSIQYIHRRMQVFETCPKRLDMSRGFITNVITLGYNVWDNPSYWGLSKTSSKKCLWLLGNMTLQQNNSKYNKNKQYCVYKFYYICIKVCRTYQYIFTLRFRWVIGELGYLGKGYSKKKKQYI